MDKTRYRFIEREWGLHVVNDPDYVMIPAVISTKWPAMLQKAKEMGKHRILIESENFQHRMNLQDWLHLKDLLLKQAPEGLRIAFVLRGFKHTPATELISTMLNNYGIANQLFDNTEEAIKWLTTMDLP